MLGPARPEEVEEQEPKKEELEEQEPVMPDMLLLDAQLMGVELEEEERVKT